MTTVKDETILFFSLPRHDGEYNSTPWQIASELARNNRVIFADHPFTFLEMLTGLLRPAIRKRIKAYINPVAAAGGNFTVLTMPFVWPVNFLAKGKIYNFFSQLNHRILARRINRFLRSRDIKSLVYVNAFDFYYPRLDKYLDTILKLKVYHCIDPMIKPFTLKHGSYLEKALVRRADIIISTSPALQKKFSTNPFLGNYLVPNGADVSFFSKAMDPDRQLHPKVNGIQGKVLGYLGNIERRIDYSFLLRVLEYLPDWTLVMAGPVDVKYVPEALIDHKNVVFTSSIPYHETPGVIRRFDVAIIPFMCDEVSAGIYPLKMFEYLAAGKPVVSTNFNEEILAPLSDFVYTAATPEEFANEVLRSYATDSAAMADERHAMAAKNSWEERAIVFGSILHYELRNTKRHVI